MTSTDQRRAAAQLGWRRRRLRARIREMEAVDRVLAAWNTYLIEDDDTDTFAVLGEAMLALSAARSRRYR